MIRLSSIIKTFELSFLSQYQLLPSHRKALSAMKVCRTDQSPMMLTQCDACDEQSYVPHSCGHRNCPHCQAHESQQWLDRQLKRLVPGDYFLLTFTLPAQFRNLAWFHQRTIYQLMIHCCWQTLKKFSKNDKALQGVPGVIAVLHTHARDLGYHPHVHSVMPAAAIDKMERLWRTKKSATDKPFLFDHKALAIVFRAKLLDAIKKEGLLLPKKYPKKWVVHCKSVGTGEKALTYLGRYLYRGVIQEKDIIACDNGNVTYRYQDSDTKKMRYKTVTGEKFLWLVLQHILPKRFRRARNFGFLHPNSKSLIQVIQWVFKLDPKKALAHLRQRPTMICRCCGGLLKIIQTRIIPTEGSSILVPT